jgi:ribonuclease Z
LKVTVLGCHAATPRTLTSPTAQVVFSGKHVMLIDCGEGTQSQLRRYKVRFQDIQHIFISHLHGDHFFGLPGLIATFRLLGRHHPLHVYGPQGMKDAVMGMLLAGQTHIDYPLFFHEVDTRVPQVLFEDQGLIVRTFPLNHRVPTQGFVFEQKAGPRHIRRSMIAETLPKYAYDLLKSGRDYISEQGDCYSAEAYTKAGTPTRKYAFCSDTQYDAKIVPHIQGVDLLYHESTFLNTELSLAKKTGHSTAEQAGMIASMARVETLLLGHFSTRYPSTDVFVTEAKLHFDRVLCAYEGMELSL